MFKQVFQTIFWNWNVVILHGFLKYCSSGIYIAPGVPQGYVHNVKARNENK